jgi:O-acetylhomoserine (thiol)-lyase
VEDATGSRDTPIHMSTSFVFRDADHGAKLFNLAEVGNIYSRLTNPTVSALQSRLADLEGGCGARPCIRLQRAVAFDLKCAKRSCTLQK